MNIEEILDDWYSIYIYDLRDKVIAKNNYYLLKEFLEKFHEDFKSANIKKYKKAIIRLSEYNYYSQDNSGEIIFNRELKKEDIKLLMNLLSILEKWNKR